VTAGIRFWLREMPLERDEGEYALAGQQMLQGIAPYKTVYNMKFPGTYAAYALLMAIFGQTPAGIYLGLLFVNAATIIMMFLLGTRLANNAAGLAAAALYAYGSVSGYLLGVAAHATHFVVFMALGGLLLLAGGVKSLSNAKLFCAGLLLGASVL